jgi:hypothetical protein
MSDQQPEHHHQPDDEIQIDRVHYSVHQHIMTGAELRLVPKAPIGPDRDLFEVIPGHKDKKIEDAEQVEIHNGLRFFAAPATINPGNTDIRRTEV